MARRHKICLQIKICAWNGFEIRSGTGTAQGLDVALLADKFPWSATAKSRSAPSACDDEVRIFMGQFGQVSSLFSFSGGFGMISICVTEKRALADRRADAVRSCSPPPMTTTCLPWAEMGRLSSGGSFRYAAVLLWQEIHGEVNPARSRPGTGQSREFFRTSTNQHRIKRSAKLLGILCHANVRTVVECHTFGFHLANRRSIRCFSILKSGMP